MSAQTWGVRIFGVELKAENVKEKYRECVECRDIYGLEISLREDGIDLPPFLGFEDDAYERFFIGFFPVYPWRIARFDKADFPQTEQEAKDRIKEVLAKIVIDVSKYKDEDFEDFDTYNCG